MVKKDLIVSFSGGRTSAYMAQWLKCNKADEFNMHFVFANTGKEREQTLEFVNQCDEYFKLGVVWIEPQFSPVFGEGVRCKITDFNSASRSGEPFEEYIKKHSIPNRQNMTCSNYLKRYPIRNYARSIGLKKYYTAIGIRIDEIDRMSANRDKDRIIYPLIQMIPTTKNDINSFWMEMPFDLQLKSYEGNCDMCWKKSFRKLQTIAIEHPELTEWWIEMERKYGTYAPEHKITEELKCSMPFTFYRERKSMIEIIEMSKSLKKKAEDDSKISQLSFFEQEILDPLDNNNGCEESCEPF